MSNLETVLVWEGEIDNQRIRELLGVKSVWASRVLGALGTRLGVRAARETAHAPLRLVTRQAEQEHRQSPDDYLRIASRASESTERESMLEDARRDLSVVAPETFAKVVQAIRQGIGLEMTYRSMNHPTGSVRVVFPHSLVRAPRRWHMRAWCTERKDFRDFTLGRVGRVLPVTSDAPFSRSDDIDWNEFVMLTVIAHPELNNDQRAMIAAEYFPGASARQLKVRRCLAGYIIQDLRLATDAIKQKPPEYQLLVSNADKLGRAIWSD
ncbi:MAG: WYL domain-containing protein [Rhodocyclaceae bacterium]|nr:WYL domain-containing protein [Rhodocyclaceae bacterium]